MNNMDMNKELLVRNGNGNSGAGVKPSEKRERDDNTSEVVPGAKRRKVGHLGAICCDFGG